MISILRLLLFVLVLSGLVHIFAVLATPEFAGQKAWHKIKRHVADRRLTPLKDQNEALALLGQADPAMAYALCRFSLDDGPVHVLSESVTNFWSVTLYNTMAEVVYSVHDNALQSGQLNLTIANQALKEDQPPDEQTLPLAITDQPSPLPRPHESDEEDSLSSIAPETGIQVIIKEGPLFLVLKMFRSSHHYERLINETLAAAECK